MYHVGITGSLPIRHSLLGDYGEESRPHEHTYRIEWIYSAVSLSVEGFAVDIARMEAARDAVLARISGVYLNDLPFFANRQPSVENFAAFLSAELEAEIAAGGHLGDAVVHVELRVWENETAWASFERPLRSSGVDLDEVIRRGPKDALA
jgi:6-pyruvoyltetrahydropterin/6-carboxytetrahydropterin synthase